jgi:hypothetical protein
VVLRGTGAARRRNDTVVLAECLPCFTGANQMLIFKKSRRR